jgi:hypothetical protein
MPNRDREPGWAIEMAFKVACDLGLRFQQDAIFWVSGTGFGWQSADPIGSVRRSARLTTGLSWKPWGSQRSKNLLAEGSRA